MRHCDERVDAGLEGGDSFGSVQSQQPIQQVNKAKSIYEFVRRRAVIHLHLETGYFRGEKQRERWVLTRNKRDILTSIRSSRDLNSESLMSFNVSAPVAAAYSSGVCGDKNIHKAHFQNQAKRSFSKSEDNPTFSLHVGPPDASTRVKYRAVYFPAQSRWSSG